tara:strand:+ start:60 stop:395 length:336 start_codon:yes stop_codon:yes gene_type:complete
MSNNNEIKNDNEYLEFSNQMKEQYNELEAEKKLTEMENYELKKEIVTIYGLIRVLDTCLSDLHNIPNFVVELAERTRGGLSSVMDKYIFNIKDESDDEEEDMQVLINMQFD